MKDFSKEIKAHALKNSLEFGKAEYGRILPKLFQHGLAKEDIQRIMPSIKKIVQEINKLPEKKREKEFELYKSLIKENVGKEKTLPVLQNVTGTVITRLPPEPSKYLHLGHGLSFLINYEYAKKYNGKCLLRFEDANPEKVSQEYVDSILEDIRDYLGIHIDGIRYVSDDIPLLYQYAERLIKKGNTYICFCDREQMQKLRHKGKECECRSQPVDETLQLWKPFLAGKYKEGKAVLRLKGDMNHVNHVMRDPVIFRIVKTKHFRHNEEYSAWPTYDFYNPIEDSIMKVTHVLRSNEFDVRIELHEYIKNLLGLQKQTVVQYGRFLVIGAETKGRDIREKIEAGEYHGWDDPRLVTLRALRRRGIKKEVLDELVKQLGLSQKQVHIEFSMIASISRKLLDAVVHRYYFVKNPIKINITKMPKIKEATAKLHPAQSITRNIAVGKDILIQREDLKNLKGKEVRLMNLCTISLDKKSKFLTLENRHVPKIQWVSEGVPVKVLMGNGKWIKGVAEENISGIKIGEIIQFERFGFVRLDAVSKGVYEFWFSHS